MPYTAITAAVIQGHINDQTHSQNSTNVNGFNQISDNIINDYMQTLNDGGAMYIEGHQAQYVDNPDGTVNQTATLANGMQAVGNVAYDKVGFSPVMYDDAGSEYINWQDNVAFKVNGNSAQGGCDPTGPFGLEGNMASGGFEKATSACRAECRSPRSPRRTRASPTRRDRTTSRPRRSTAPGSTGPMRRG